MKIEKEFSDWTIEEMVAYVLTGRKPMKKELDRQNERDNTSNTLVQNKILVKCHKTVLG